ncbi:hypothetical protein VTJ83DRAFT_7217 [Remersonia thermophila]|uniref:Protein kinase domain-containing protein n=1 Tax=Remersonia thermophila TaxID=72144 RepID=A0ABR4D575_9PEZI
MNRDRPVPAGPRRENQSPPRRSRTSSPTKSVPISSSRSTLGDAPPMLSASSSNNHSLFSFGARNGLPDNVTDDPSASFEFLPSVNFDDLQSSLESASAEFRLGPFSDPVRDPVRDPLLPVNALLHDAQNHVAERPEMSRNPASANAPVQPAVARSRAGSILRRPSTSSRQSSVSSITPGNATTLTPPAGPAPPRSRRQNQYPPVSSATAASARPPRKSMGDAVLGGEFELRKRRPSVASLTDRNPPEPVARSSVDGGSRGITDYLRIRSSSRSSKAKSAQPARSSQSTLSAEANGAATLQAESPGASAGLPRSPRAAKVTTATPSKRVSVMPGAPQLPHVTGLGARTISPTDTRRLKRLSMHHTQASSSTAPLLPNPPPLTAEMRSASRSPSMLPRKIPTPSSSRTTPDLSNRKSYSSGLSLASNGSLSSAVRTSTASITHRSSQSRLPAPKALALHTAAAADDAEEVPPVPAIPKAYESPKDAHLADVLLDKRKSNLTGNDASSIRSGGSAGSGEGPAKLRRKPSHRKSIHTSKPDVVEAKSLAPAEPKKLLQPLRLPPIKLGPLSTPTAAKIAALQDHGQHDRALSPPPSRQILKTPTTPMTASKTTFFRTRPEERTDVQHLRSSSSIHRTRRETTPPPLEPASSSDSFTTKDTPAPRTAPSPFLSMSLPKGGHFDAIALKRSKTGGDYNALFDAGAADAATPAKPSGPRAQKPAIPRPPKSPPPQSSPEEQEPPTPSSMSSLRRKLSLSWKRNASKSSSGGQSLAEDKAVKHDAMPPPRLPASATHPIPATKNGSPSPSVKSSGGGYLESRRRKSSASSLNSTLNQEARHRADGAGHAKRESSLVTVNERTTTTTMATTTTQHNSSVVQRILKPRHSTAALRHHDAWSLELDKDDLIAEEEMKKLGLRRKDTELAARTLDALRKRATPKERVSPQEAIRIAVLNIYERGEIVDYKDVYFCGTQNAAKVVGDPQSDAPNFGYDDERGDYTIVPGDHLAYRYEIIDVLGKGSFGQVVRCIDHKTGVLVAVKIIRNKKRFHQQALVEVNILQKLREWDPHNKHSMVNFTHSFYFRGHLCISTELLDMNLYEFIKANAFRGFSLKLIRRFTKQILSSLNLLKQHKVIHCDLKPENILLRHPLHSEIKVIDFGSSCFEHEKVYTYIQSRFYRSPEVILGMNYGLPIDMWSLGCILAELYTGVPIFPGENEQEQLACIMEVFGPPEKHLIEKSTRKKLFFDSMGKPRLTVSSKGRRRRPSSKTLQQVLKCDNEAFLDFVARCLRWDPDRRMKPEEAIRHEFITGQKSSMPIPRAYPPSASAHDREHSPSKRIRSLGSVPRPLPEPPAPAAIKSTTTATTTATTTNSTTASLRSRDAASYASSHHHHQQHHHHSSSKSSTSTLTGAATGATRRVSGMNAASSATVGGGGGGTGSVHKRTGTAANASLSHAPTNGNGSIGTGAGAGAEKADRAAPPALANSASNSSLPRASIRAVSSSGALGSGGVNASKTDLAAAGASVAMGRRG